VSKLSINISDLFNLSDAELFDPHLISDYQHITIDSRLVKQDSLFIAIKGNKFDGHKFINEAVNNGATAVVIEKRKLKKYDNLKVPIIAVKDTTTALGEIASIWRSKLKAKVICITGSSGKTTTKDILVSLLKSKYKVAGTLLNNNNHIGVPLTLLSAKSDDDFIVIEAGTNHFGEIDYTTKIVSPDYSIITNIGASHLEFLKSKSGVLREKEFLFKNTKKNGKVFINSDDPLLTKLKSKYSNNITYGFSENCDIKGKIIDTLFDGRCKLSVQSSRYNFEAILPLYGIQNAKNILAASAIAISVGLNKKSLIDVIQLLKAQKQRLNVLHLKNKILIDDTYNANPESMKASIELVGSIAKHGRKILVLGDMFELGEKSEVLHRLLLTVIKRNKISEVLLIGTKMKQLFEELQSKGIDSKYFGTRKSLGNYLKKANFDDCTVLIKGSRGMKMEEFVKIVNERFV
jgi:UDP-N-acetylmuramoyl-tripeptide--D-alanyl-D-alanine ligase